MRAIVHTRYGPPEELQLQEVPKPAPQDHEILIRIRATTVTSSDCNLRNLTFAPKWTRLPMRLQLGLTRPKFKILGVEWAGEVEAVGTGVTRFGTGDRVFGSSEPGLGAHAEYLCLSEESALTTMPARTSWEEAATLPLAGITALYFVRDQGNVQPGQRVLLNGASGGVGTFAVQLAKYYGAEVTAVCSADNADRVRSLGADRVIDYTREDFTKSGETYDVIFDVVSKLSFSQCKDSLKDQGTYLVTLPTSGVLLPMMWPSLAGGRKIKNGASSPNTKDLVFLKELVEAGKLRAVIDRCYPLEQTAEAFRYVETGRKKGSVVIVVDGPTGNPGSLR